MASASRPGLGSETLQHFADLQRQVGESIPPLRTRQRRRTRQHVRRLVLRSVALLLPLVVAALLAVDTGGSRTWIGDRWDDLTRASTGQQQPPADEGPADRAPGGD